ncbi:MAG: hypothetical protein K9M02_12245 [Thiohalocapsa sp.]|nr:hypothetical protein [Thiohalocapsa sp.]
MNIRNHFRGALPATLLVGLCLAGAHAHAAGRLVLETEPSPTIAPEAVEYRWSDGALEVSGRVAKQQIRHGRIHGHVDIELLDADGNVLERRSAALTRHLPNRRDPRRASFDKTIDNVPEAVAGIRVSHRVGHWY